MGLWELLKKIGNDDEGKYGRKCKNCSHFMTSHHAQNEVTYRFGRENVVKWKRLNCKRCDCKKYV